MTRNHEPRKTGHKLPKESKPDTGEAKLQQAETKIRSLYAEWQSLDNTLIRLAGQTTWTFTLAELCQQLQALTESLTELLEEKPQLKKMRRRPRYSEQELTDRKRRAMTNPNSRVREMLLKDLEESFFKS